MSTTPAGWYPDPSGDSSMIRYWDGSQWTDHVQPNPEAAASAAPEYAQQQASQAAPQQGSYQPAPTAPAGMQSIPVPAKDRSGQATAGFACGMAGLVLGLGSFLIVGFGGGASVGMSMIFLFSFVLAIPAIILSALGMKSKRRGMAIGGLILGIIGVLCLVGFIALAVFLLSSMPELFNF